MSDDARAEGARQGEEPEPSWRRRRPRDIWETEVEPFPGALALWDLEDAPADDALTVVARHAVLRCLAETARGHRGGARRSGRAARHYLAASPDGDAVPLRRLLRMRAAPAPVLFHALLAAGMAARRARHDGGCYTLLRWAYELARLEHRPRAAARVAARLAGLAFAADAPMAARRWSARVRVLLEAGVPAAANDDYVERMEKNASGGGYDAAARRQLAQAIASGGVAACPVCSAPVTLTEVRPAPGVPYVRRRVWVLCTGCRRTAAVDVPGKPPAAG